MPPDLSFPMFPKAFTTGRPEEGFGRGRKWWQKRGATQKPRPQPLPGRGRGSLPGWHVQRHRGELKSTWG